MAGKVAATELEVAGRTVRVSNPDKIYFPERGLHQAGRGLVLRRGRRRHHAIAARASDHIGALAERRVRGRRALHPGGQPAAMRSTRNASRPGACPSGWRPRRSRSPVDVQLTSCARSTSPTSPGPPSSARSSSTRGRYGAADPDAPDELRIDLDPQPGTNFADAVTVAREAQAVLEELGLGAYPKTSGGRGVHIYVRIASTVDVRPGTRGRRSRSAGSSTAGARTSPPSTGGRRSGASGSSSTSTRWPATVRSPAPTRCGPTRARPCRPRSPGTSWPRSSPNDFTLDTVRERFATIGDPHATIDDVAHDITPLLEWVERDETRRRGRPALPAGLPEDAGRTAPGPAEPQEPQELDRRG